jgi:hypothetical protein
MNRKMKANAAKAERRASARGESKPKREPDCDCLTKNYEVVGVILSEADPIPKDKLH